MLQKKELVYNDKLFQNHFNQLKPETPPYTNLYQTQKFRIACIGFLDKTIYIDKIKKRCQNKNASICYYPQ